MGVVLAIQPLELQPTFSSKTGTHETRITNNNKMTWMSMKWIDLKGMTMELTKMKDSGVCVTQAATWMNKTRAKVLTMKRATKTRMRMRMRKRKKMMKKVTETKARRNSLDFLSFDWVMIVQEDVMCGPNPWALVATC
jgi:hypothetical protein